MKYTAILVSAVCLFTSTTLAQQDGSLGTGQSTDTGSSPQPDTSPAEAPAEPTAAAPEEEKRSPYYKKVQGWLWLEGFAGPSSFDPDRFGSLGDGFFNAPRLRGPEYGFSFGTGFGGGFFLGWFYRQADYTQYKLMKTGLEFQPTIRIPYVHIMFRIDLGYTKIFSGNPYGLQNADNGGFVATGGVGIRVPIVRWMSFVASIEWSYLGISMRGDDPLSGARVEQWLNGRQLSGTFGLTFHFIGVRKN